MRRPKARMAQRVIAHVVAHAGSAVAAIAVIVSVKPALKDQMTLLKALSSMPPSQQL